MDTLLTSILSRAPELAFAVLISGLWIYNARQSIVISEQWRLFSKERDEAWRTYIHNRDEIWRSFITEQRELDRVYGRQHSDLISRTANALVEVEKRMERFEGRLAEVHTIVKETLKRGPGTD